MKLENFKIGDDEMREIGNGNNLLVCPIVP